MRKYFIILTLLFDLYLSQESFAQRGGIPRMYGFFHAFQGLAFYKKPPLNGPNSYAPAVPTLTLENKSAPGRCNEITFHFWAADATHYSFSMREIPWSGIGTWGTLPDSVKEITLDNLDEKTAYEFRVEAINNWGRTRSESRYRPSCR